MNATTVSPGADSAFAATIRDISKKGSSRFARPYALKLHAWIKTKLGAEVFRKGTLVKGQITYCFQPLGENQVKVTITEHKGQMLPTTTSDLEVLPLDSPEHAECMKLLGLEVQP